MDALRQNVNSAERSLKAATYRHAQATSKLTSVNKALKVAVAEVENAAGSDAIAVAKAQKAAARVTRKAAEKALAEAEGELEDRTAEAEVAKDAYNEHKSSRPRRINPRDKYEEPTAPPEYNEIVETAQPINETTIATFLAETKSAFADIPAMSIFPEPPAALCAKPSCARGQEPEAARDSFHPDRFARCNDDVRADFQSKAGEIYTVVDSMFQQLATNIKPKGEKNMTKNGRKSGDYSVRKNKVLERK